MSEKCQACLINAYVESNQLEKAINIFKDNKFSPNIFIYSTIMKGFSKCKNFNGAVKLYNDIKQENKVQMNLYFLNSFLECAYQCKQYKYMQMIYQIIKDDKNIQEDLISKSTMLKGLFQGSQIQEGIKVFNNLRQNNEVDEILYNSLLDGFLKQNQFQYFEPYYQLMIDDGINISIITQSIFVNYLIKSNQIERANNMVLDIENRYDPGIIIYSNLVHGLIKNEDFKSVIALYTKLKQKNYNIDAIFINIIIPDMLRLNQLQFSKNIILDSIDQGQKLAKYSYEQLIQHMVKEKNTDDKNLLKIYYHMKKCRLNLNKKLQILLAKKMTEAIL